MDIDSDLITLQLTYSHTIHTSYVFKLLHSYQAYQCVVYDAHAYITCMLISRDILGCWTKMAIDNGVMLESPNLMTTLSFKGQHVHIIVI